MSELTEMIAAAEAEARSRFNTWRGVAIADQGPMPTDATDALQLDLMRRTRASHDERTVLELVRELGETFEAEAGDDQTTCLGRVLVQAGHLLIRHGLALGPVLALARAYQDVHIGPGWSPVGYAGNLARVVVDGAVPLSKRVTGPAPGSRPWRQALCAAVAGVIAAGADHVEVNSAGGDQVDLLEVYRIVGGELAARLAPYESVDDRVARVLNDAKGK